MKRFSYLSILILFFISLQNQASPLTIECGQLFQSSEFISSFAKDSRFSSALEPTILQRDGTVKVTIDYTNKIATTRQIELPRIVQSIPPSEKLYIAIVAGNSGTPYENTYHSLAFQFADYLQLRSGRTPQVTTSGSLQAPSFQESLTVQFDDGSRLPWKAEFHTEKPSFRTSSGEVFYYLRFFNDKKLLLVRPIGDYNEVGDFGILVAQALNVPSERIILIHDDLSTPEGKVTSHIPLPEIYLPRKPLHRMPQPKIPLWSQAFTGNNAVFSVIRNLSYQIADQLVQVIQRDRQKSPLLQRVISTDHIQQMHAEIIRRADIRYKDHLGQPQAFNMALKNFDSIYTPLPILLGLDSKTLKRLKAQAEESFYEGLPESDKNQIQELRQELKGLAVLVNDSYLSETQRSVLTNKMTPLRQQLKMLTTDKFEKSYKAEENELQALLEKIQATIQRNLKFATIQMGILPANGMTGSNRDLVLGEIHPKYPKEDVFKSVEMELIRILSENY